MKKQEKIEIINKKTIWYCISYNWLEIKEIEYWINDFIIYTLKSWSDIKVKRSVIKYNINWDPFFYCNKSRVKLSDIIKLY